MTPARLIECMELLSLTDAQIMRYLNCNDTLVRRWKGGKRAIPPDVAEWIERLVVYWQDNPPPILRGRARYEEDA